MGFGDFLRDTLGGAAAGFISGGPAGALVGAAGGAASNIGGGDQQRRQMQPPQTPTVTGQPTMTPGFSRNPGTGRSTDRRRRTTPSDSTGVSVQLPSVNVPGIGSVQGPSFDYSSVQRGLQAPPAPSDPPAQTNVQTQMQFGSNPLISILMKKAMKGRSKALFQAIASGAINNGVIQQPIPLQAPDGSVERYTSPPGYRIVTVNGQKLSVLKPVARAMGVLPKGSKTTLQKYDAMARKLMSAQKTIKKLAPKVGLKTSNRKSGVSR